MRNNQTIFKTYNHNHFGFKVFLKSCLLVMIFGCFASNLISQSLNKAKLNYSFEYSLYCSNNRKTEVILTNNSDSSLLVSWNVNEKLWKNFDDLKVYIEQLKVDSITNLDKILNQAFMFVYYQTKHFPPLPNDEISNNPLLNINSIGSGVCNNRSLILVSIFQNMGYESRMVHLGGHSVAEVKSNNKWIMLDVTNGTMFYNSEQLPMSVNEIAENSTNSRIYYIENSRDLRELNSFLNAKWYIRLFETIENNSLEYLNTPDKDGDYNTFSLPAKSFIRFDIQDKAAIENEIYSFCRIDIAKGISDSINIPFVIHHIEGDGDLKIDDINSLDFDSVYLYPPGKYYVKSEGLTIVTLINNKILENAGENNIIVQCDKNYKLELNHKSRNVINSKLYQTLQNKASIEKIKAYYSFFENNPGFINENQITNFDDLKKAAYKLNFEVYNYSHREINVTKKLRILKKELKSKRKNEQDFIQIISNPSFIKIIIVGLLEYNEQSFVQQLKSIYPEHEIYTNSKKK
jgi:hypothetical protein